MSSTVTVGSMEVTSNHESASSMLEALKPAEESSPEPRITRDGGEPVEAQETDDASEAARVLGKKGGEAAAAKRAAKEQDTAKAKPAHAATEDDDAEAIAEAEKLEKEGKLGKPRDDPRARLLVVAREKAEAKRVAAEATARAEAAERRAAEAERRVADRRAPAAEPAKEPTPKVEAAGKKPVVEDFEKYEDFVEALADYKADQRIAKLREESEAAHKADSQRQSFERAAKAHFERVEKVKAEHPDFIEKTAGLTGKLVPSFLLPPDQPLSAGNVLADELLISETGPLVTMYLADHQDEYQRILSLPRPADVQRAVAKLEGILSRPDAAPLPSAPRAEVSQAKPPVRPVAGSPHTADPLEVSDELSFEEHARRMNARDQAARRGNARL